MTRAAWWREPGRGRYAHDERERRFLVREVPVLLAPLRTVEDRYLDGTTLRLRRVSAGDRAVHKLTQKVRSRPDDPGEVRLTNTYLTAGEHAVLSGLPAAALLKTRGVVEVAPRWVVDRFAGPLEGLVLAEVELQGQDEDVPLPDWLGREVTRDDRFSGGRLARTAASDLPVLLERAQASATGT